MPVVFGFDLSTVLLLLTGTLFVIVIVKSWLEVPKNIPPLPALKVPILGHLPYMVDPRKKLMEWRKT